MTIKTHIETMQQLLLGLDMNWAATDGKIKVAWLSMVGKMAAELELVAMTESSVLETIKHGDQAQNYLDKQKVKKSEASEYNPC